MLLDDAELGEWGCLKAIDMVCSGEDLLEEEEAIQADEGKEERPRKA